MNKGTFVVLLVAAGLLAYMGTRGSEEEESAKPATVPGYLEQGAQTEWRKRKENPLLFLSEKKEDRDRQFKTPPYDHIALTRDGATVEFEKAGEDDWKMVKPVKSEVESFRIKNMLEAFATDTALTPARTVKNPEHLVDFGLEEESAISITLSEKGVSKIALVIGSAAKVKSSEGGGQDVYDTFVMQAGDDKQVFRAKQKDLRSAFDHDVGALRSKKAFSFDKTDITKVTIVDPDNTKAPKIVLAATWEKPPEPPKDAPKPPPGEKEKKPEAKGTFSIVSPTIADYRLGKLDTFLSQIANMRVTEFVMGKKPAEDTGLLKRDAAARIEIELSDADPVVIVFGAEQEKDKAFYAQVEGRDEYMIVSKNTRGNLIKKLGDLRNKSVLGDVKDDDVTRIEVKNEHTGEGAMVFEKTAAGWQMTAPQAQTPFEREMKTLLSGVKTLRASSFHDEAPKPEDSGLATPTMTLKATIAGQEKTIVFGAEKDSNVEAHIPGTQMYFKVSSWTRNKFTKKPSDFRDKVVIKLADGKDIAALQLIHKEETVELKRAGGGWEMLTPETINKDTGLKDAAVEAIATTLKALSIKDFTDKTVDAVGLTAPAFKLIATLKTGAKIELAASDTKEGDAHYVTITSPQSPAGTVYTLGKFKLDNLRKKAADLKQ